MARLSTSATPSSAVAGTARSNGHLPAPANAQGTPPTVPIGNTHEEQEDDNRPSFDFNKWKQHETYRKMAQPVAYDPSLLPNGSRSLVSISTQSFFLGLTLSACLLLTFWLVVEKQSAIWRLFAFFATLSLFHFLEFYTTARFNLPAARSSSFLLFNNGTAYNVAHTLATFEILVSHYILPSYYQSYLVVYPSTIFLGLAMVAVGQVVRSVAMAQAGTNFNHTPQQTKKEGHELVTRGVYRWSRHPSYFGFFWWALGTQVLVGNRICLLGYAVALWRFFYMRIRAEERTLVQFFGEDYREYKKRVGVLIPFIR